MAGTNAGAAACAGGAAAGATTAGLGATATGATGAGLGAGATGAAGAGLKAAAGAGAGCATTTGAGGVSAGCEGSGADEDDAWNEDGAAALGATVGPASVTAGEPVALNRAAAAPSSCTKAVWPTTARGSPAT